MAYIARDVDDLRRRLADVLTAAPACPEGVGAASSLFTVPEQEADAARAAGTRRCRSRRGSCLAQAPSCAPRWTPSRGPSTCHGTACWRTRPRRQWTGPARGRAASSSCRPSASATQRRSKGTAPPSITLGTRSSTSRGMASCVRARRWSRTIGPWCWSSLSSPRWLSLRQGWLPTRCPPRPRRSRRSAAGPRRTAGGRSSRRRPRPDLRATTPSSTGAAFSVLFCSLLVTTACLNFWLAYAGVSVLHWFDPETASSVDRAGIFSNDSIKTAAAIGVALAPTCFLPFQRQLATRRRQWLLLACKMFLLFESQCIKILGTYLASVQMANIVALNADAFWHITRTLQMSLLLIGCLDAFAGSYVESILLLEWRRDLSHYVLKKYMGSQAYYRMNSNSGKDWGHEISATRTKLPFKWPAGKMTLCMYGGVRPQVVTLLSSSVLIWTVVPQVTVMLLIYTVVGSLVSLWFIWNFAGITYNIQKCEADYRYSLIHVRENAEGIALMGGEKTGEGEIHTRFRDLIEARKQKISWEMMFSCFSFAFTAGGTIVPCVLLAELFFQMKLDVGIVAQAGLRRTRGLHLLIHQQLRHDHVHARGGHESYRGAAAEDRQPR
ncbi:unnamed protein product [Prorocentrum cordatum]|uniref:ABC transmembrane type-1 domain-containing protein n=1 Tax=Prorocentrum cordatum TaxID=2364126 RepID=A0ABN9QLT1_9DINO|nr:unnamed protein product [Polarella glacialis]